MHKGQVCYICQPTKLTMYKNIWIIKLLNHAIFISRCTNCDYMQNSIIIIIVWCDTWTQNVKVTSENIIYTYISNTNRPYYPLTKDENRMFVIKHSCALLPIIQSALFRWHRFALSALDPTQKTLLCNHIIYAHYL